MNEFQRDTYIDPTALDLECLRQTDLFAKWAERAVEARKEMESAKLKMEVLEASLKLQCQKKPNEFDILRVTDKSVEAAVRSDDRFVNAAEAYIHAREVSSMMDKAVSAMEMKKRMLENLVTLHGQSYFSSPSISQDLTRVYSQQQMERQNRVTTKTKRRLRKKTKKNG